MSTLTNIQYKISKIKTNLELALRKEVQFFDLETVKYVASKKDPIISKYFISLVEQWVNYRNILPTITEKDYENIDTILAEKWVPYKDLKIQEYIVYNTKIVDKDNNPVKSILFLFTNNNNVGLFIASGIILSDSKITFEGVDINFMSESDLTNLDISKIISTLKLEQINLVDFLPEYGLKIT